MPRVVPITPRVLHEHAADRLRQMIVEGRIAPGAKLNERELAAALDVSRTPLREAIRRLAAEGLVELQPHRGAVAVQLAAQDIADTFEVIAGLEGQAGELAAARITAAELAEIRALHQAMALAHARRDLPVYYRRNAEIHDRINLAAHNPVLARTYRTVNSRLQALRFRSNFDERKWERAMQEHERMVELLAARDGPRLRKLLIGHLEHKRDAVLEQLAARALQARA
ncbi:MAG TPA: GntR family transcriptional regulator [Caldimonas sp.]|nr:GntR family transcriptional regulator [Caldimonas sp.]